MGQEEISAAELEFLITQSQIERHIEKIGKAEVIEKCRTINISEFECATCWGCVYYIEGNSQKNDPPERSLCKLTEKVFGYADIARVGQTPCYGTILNLISAPDLVLIENVKNYAILASIPQKDSKNARFVVFV